MAVELITRPRVKTRTSDAFASIELFTGAGGLALGTHYARFNHRVLIEWDQHASRTVQANASADVVPGIRNWTVRTGDIRQVDFRAHEGLDLIAGGPPCQPFSIGGKHKGMSDSRNVIPEFIRSVREAMPRAFIFENVRGLTRPMFRPYFDYIKLQLSYPEVLLKRGEDWVLHRDRLGAHAKRARPSYIVTHCLLNAADYGVPQVRHRVFVVGFRADLGTSFEFPQSTHSFEALVWDQSVGGEYWGRHGLKRPFNQPALGRLVNAPAAKPWRTVRDAIGDLPEPTTQGHLLLSGHWVQPGARSYPGHTGSEMDLPAKTLKAGDHGVPGGENMLRRPDGSVRYFTVLETARLQTFPDDWEFEGAWGEIMRQLGNAVPVRLAQVVAEHVAKQLKAT